VTDLRGGARRTATDPDVVRADLALPSSVQVDGVEIRYGVSGEAGRDLVLVHGHGAHHLWWHAVAPLLEQNWRVIQLDLSGHGDSGHRPVYTPWSWAADVHAVVDAVGARRPVLVGHSLGGMITLAAAVARPGRVGGLVLVDAAPRPPHRYRPVPAEGVRLGAVQGGQLRPHALPTQEALLARFRLMPPQPPTDPELLDPVARFSCRQGPEGWTWKHDRAGLARMTDAEMDDIARRLTVPVALLYGQESAIVDAECAEHLSTVAPCRDVVVVPGAHHHLVLEQPEVCAAHIDRLAHRVAAEAPDRRGEEPDAVP
jgi:pimeloyl-ACP methyl ester carboxylesterase